MSPVVPSSVHATFVGDTAFDLIIAKCGASILLTGASMIGLMAPFLVFRLVPSGHSVSVAANDDAAVVHVGPSSGHAGCAASTRHSGHSTQEQQQQSNTVVSIANCVSAGILLWTGLMHFFLESTSSFSSASLCPGHVGKGGSVACLEYGVGRAVLCFICGILIPLVIEKIVWPWVTLTIVGQPQVGRPYSEGSGGESIAALMVVHGQHSHGSHGHGHAGPHLSKSTSSSSNSSIGGSSTTAPPSSPQHPVAVSSITQKKRQQSKDLASAVLIAILMSVHSATEGIAIGVEPSTASMRGSVSPLVVHKAFDGWLVGVSVYRTCEVLLRNNGSIFDIVRYVFVRSPQRYALWIWLSALPFFLMSVAMVVPVGVVSTSLDDAATGSAAGAGGGGGHSHAGATLPVAIAQATSSGSFLYVALCAILLEELSEVTAAAPSIATIKKHVILIASCMVGLVLGSILSGGHE